jgi:hypothetical protein
MQPHRQRNNEWMILERPVVDTPSRHPSCHPGRPAATQDLSACGYTQNPAPRRDFHGKPHE